jgi:hypothetical protein
MAQTAQIAAPSREEVDLAWSIYRTLLLAEVDDHSLADSMEHQRKVAVARFRFQSMYDAWNRA